MTFYSMFDAKQEMFYTPILMANDATAIRWFTSVINGKDEIFSNFPEDFSLYKIAEFDERHGNIIASKKELITGTQVKKEV